MTRNWLPSRDIAFARGRARMGKKRDRAGKNGDRYFAVPHYIMETFAWKCLSVYARAAWLEFGPARHSRKTTAEAAFVVGAVAQQPTLSSNSRT
jgi:hypothetical protein